MMLRNILSRVQTNLGGWNTKRKIVVFDSDDWGSIRMPSGEVYDSLLRKGIRVDLCPYNRNDSLASAEDLEALFHVLLKFKDRNGNNPVITANTVVANPDFESTQKNGFSDYQYEPFTTTLQRYPGHQNSFKLWQQGISSKLFHPQFHGREHLNILLWLKLLRDNQPIFLEGFRNNLWGFGPAITGNRSYNIQAAFDTDDQNEIEFHKEIISDGLNLFERIFGYRARGFIANNYIWDLKLEKTLAECGIDTIKSMKYQKQPKYITERRKLIRRRVGDKNSAGQVYLIRNVTFEPAQKPPAFDNVGMALKEMNIAFFQNKPAIIDTHRLNYIGSVNLSNRIRSLQLLEDFLKRSLAKWPDIEFMNTTQLAEEIRGN